MKKVLAVDLDDTLLDCNGTLMDYHNLRFGTAYTRADVFTHRIAEVWQLSNEETYARIHDFLHSDYHHGASVLPGVREGLLEAKKRGYHVVIITSRAEEYREQTLAWLLKNLDGLTDDIHFLGEYAKINPGKSKLDVCIDIGAVAMIEDAPHHASAIAAHGIPVYLMDAPWNQGETEPGVTRIYSLTEAVDALP